MSGQLMTAGAGGISRVARLSVTALQRIGRVRALSVEDGTAHDIGSVRVQAFRGRRWSFAMAHAAALVGTDLAVYDFAGTARAHVVPRRRSVVWVHGNELWNESTIRSDYARAIRRADRVLVISSYTLGRLEEAFGPMSTARVCWLSTEREDAPPRMEGAQNHLPVLLVVGRSDRYFAKGQDLLVRLWPRVLASVPTARLRFVGGGTHLEYLRDLARRSPAVGSIDVLGFLSEEALERAYAEAAALALIGTLEGFGIVVVEAMRYGLPVLTSTDDATREINVDGVTGHVVDRSCDDEVVDRIVRLLDDREHAATLGRNGFLRWRQHFRPSCFETRLLSAVSDLLPVVCV